MTAKTHVGAECIEHLDFTPKCQVAVRHRLIRWWMPLRSCRRAAKWMAVLPCCGLEAFTCKRHHSDRAFDQKVCARCSKHFASNASWRWVRI